MKKYWSLQNLPNNFSAFLSYKLEFWNCNLKIHCCYLSFFSEENRAPTPNWNFWRRRASSTRTPSIHTLSRWEFFSYWFEEIFSSIDKWNDLKYENNWEKILFFFKFLSSCFLFLPFFEFFSRKLNFRKNYFLQRF